MRIGFAETNLLVSTTEIGILLEIQMLEGSIEPELGDIVVTASVSYLTDLGWL